jgi:hypothetical protein
MAALLRTASRYYKQIFYEYAGKVIMLNINTGVIITLIKN